MSVEPPVAVEAAAAPARRRPSNYPEPFAARMAGREKRPLGLTRFGVNLTTLVPEAVTALRHAHSRQDEFVYVLAGEPTLVTDAGETPLRPGTCAGFKAGYPDDDLVAERQPSGWRFVRKDGSPY